MPELPEIEGLASWLDRKLHGRRIEGVRLRSVAALKTFDPPLSQLDGETVQTAHRRGKFVALHTDALYLAIHLSRAGWIRWAETPTTRKPSMRGPIVAELRFEDGTLDITEQGHEKRLAMWLVRDLDEVPGIADLGPDALDPQLDQETFQRLIRSRPGTIKRVLSDQHVIAGIGNAYSDEILHAAGVSPFTRIAKLDATQVSALFESMRAILGGAMERARGLEGRELKDDKRSHFNVHGRTGQPCPVCSAPIREVWSSERSFQYCPGCQTGGRVYADRRLSRLLK